MVGCSLKMTQRCHVATTFETKRFIPEDSGADRQATDRALSIKKKKDRDRAGMLR